jgi:hypothetical protein
MLSAYEYFARSRQAYTQFTKAGFEGARLAYERAIEADPGYALAYSGLGSIFAYRYIANARVVQERMRHSTIMLTMDTYSQVLEGMQEAATEAMESALGA